MGHWGTADAGESLPTEASAHFEAEHYEATPATPVGAELRVRAAACWRASPSTASHPARACLLRWTGLTSVVSTCVNNHLHPPPDGQSIGDDLYALLAAFPSADVRSQQGQVPDPAPGPVAGWHGVVPATVIPGQCSSRPVAPRRKGPSFLFVKDRPPPARPCRRRSGPHGWRSARA